MGLLGALVLLTAPRTGLLTGLLRGDLSPRVISPRDPEIPFLAAVERVCRMGDMVVAVRVGERDWVSCSATRPRSPRGVGDWLACRRPAVTAILPRGAAALAAALALMLVTSTAGAMVG